MTALPRIDLLKGCIEKRELWIDSINAAWIRGKPKIPKTIWIHKINETCSLAGGDHRFLDTQLLCGKIQRKGCKEKCRHCDVSCMNSQNLLIRTIEYHESIPSTNSRIQELLQQSVPPKLPCLIIAKCQTAGRGRGNKRWWSEEGAILMSLGLELSPTFLTRDQLPMLSPALARSIIKVLTHYLPEHKLEFKKPNDVLVGGKKICGILLESPTPQHVIIGIGLNVNNRIDRIPEEFLCEISDRPITSMIELLGRETDADRLINELLAELECFF